MKQIKKNIKDSKYGSMASRMASYSALAACVLTTGGDLQAQCGTAAPGAPLPVDIDGDGTSDVTIVANNFSGPYLLTTGMATGTLSSFTTMVNYSGVFTITAAGLGPGTTFGCYITTSMIANVDEAATAMGTLMWSTTLRFYDVNLFSNYAYFYSVNQAYVTASAGNALIGLTAPGASVCTAVAGATLPYAILGSCFNISSSYVLYGTADVSSMYFPNPAGGGTFTLQHPGCTDTFGDYYAGLMQTLSPLPNTIVTTNQLAIGPYYYGPNFVSQQCNPGSTFIGVEFAGGDGTQYGWVEVTYNTDGTVTCVNSGYNGCSVEEVAAAGAAAGTECINVGDATVNTGNEACTPAVCTLTSLGLAAGACVDPGTPDTADDTFTLTIDPTGTELGTTYTISGGAAGTGTYGTPFTVTLPADGAAISITVTDDTDTSCTLTEMVTAPAACSTPLMCTLTSLGLAAGACTDPGTPDTADDMFELTINPTGTDTGTTYTISGGTTGAGTYGTPFTVMLPADGAAISITVTDDNDTTCTLTEMVTAPGSCSPAPPMCEISTTVSTMCDDAGTPDDGSDDITTVMVTVNNSDPANFPTFSDDQGNAGIAYGTTLTYTATGLGSLTVNFTDDTDAACTDSITVSTGCETVENIPTVGEWGLIILGLMMSITAIVGIRQRREEEVTA